MIIAFINALLAILGSLTLAVAVFLVFDQPSQRMWSRHWMRQRLGITDIERVAPAVAQHPVVNLTPDVVITEEIANLLDAISREMQLGRSITAAFLHTHATFPLLADYLTPIAQACERGVGLAEVLRNNDITSSTAEMPSSVVFGARALWAATAASSGAIALERAASTLRERAAVSYERHAQSAQARLSIQILTWLPIAFLAWQCITNPLARWFLLATPVGLMFLAGGLGLNWYARRWMSRIIAYPAL